MATVPRTATIEDLATTHHDESRCDLIRGEVFAMPPAGGVHGKIAAGILARLWWHAEEGQLGDVYTSETGFILNRDPDVLLAPDAAFIVSGRVPGDATGFVEVAPDLVVEVVSPNDAASYVQQKVIQYLKAGVRLVWVIDPRSRTLTVYNDAGNVEFLGDGDRVEGDDVLPDFSLAVADIFA